MERKQRKRNTSLDVRATSTKQPKTHRTVLGLLPRLSSQKNRFEEREQISQMPSALDARSLHAQDGLLEIRRQLASLVEPAEAERWLHAKNTALGGKTPIHLVENGEASRVKELLIRLSEGIHV